MPKLGEKAGFEGLILRSPSRAPVSSEDGRPCPKRPERRFGRTDEIDHLFGTLKNRLEPEVLHELLQPTEGILGIPEGNGREIQHHGHQALRGVWGAALPRCVTAASGRAAAVTAPAAATVAGVLLGALTVGPVITPRVECLRILELPPGYEREVAGSIIVDVLPVVAISALKLRFDLPFEELCPVLLEIAFEIRHVATAAEM